MRKLANIGTAAVLRLRNFLDEVYLPRARPAPKHYPERSTRQAHHAHRRAQGGPGITLNPSTFKWEPRHV